MSFSQGELSLLAAGAAVGAAVACALGSGGGRSGGAALGKEASAPAKEMSGLSVQPADLKALVKQILLKAGSDANEADIVAGNLVESNVKGHDSHGIGYLTRYIPGIQSKLLKVNQHAKVVSDKGAFVLVDGNLGFGQVIGKEATEMGIAKCKQHGVAIVGVKNSHHLARIGKFAEMAASEGFVSIHFTNVAGHDPLVAPFLGKDARLGTNPFTVAFPGLPGGEPVLLDYATSELALGKVREYMTAGKALRPGVLLDKNGEPTTDSACLPPDNGTLLPFGSVKSGYKGYALAMMCELLGGVMTGGYTIAPHHFRSHKTIVNSMTAIIIDPSYLGGSADALQSEVTKLSDFVKASPAMAPGQEVEVPGEMELHYKKVRTAQGIPFDDKAIDALVANAVKVGISDAEARKVIGGKKIKLAEDKHTRFSQV